MALRANMTGPSPLPFKRIDVVGGAFKSGLYTYPTPRSTGTVGRINVLPLPRRKVSRIDGLPKLPMSPVYNRWLGGMAGKLY